MLMIEKDGILDCKQIDDTASEIEIASFIR
jgi:hypothetical protein